MSAFSRESGDQTSFKNGSLRSNSHDNLRSHMGKPHKRVLEIHHPES
jgi:hypothetical protein